MTGSKKVMAEQLAEFVVGLRYGDLSAEVIELGQRWRCSTNSDVSS